MYPTWEGLGVHSTMFVAVIAAFHVIASHLTVGAAWFNFYVERRAYRENRPELYQYLRKSAMGLLVFSYVWGAMTGVGIWQSTTAGNPRGISTLIHNFVLFWGSEWYMFLIDVVGIIVYYYTLEKVDPKTHLRLAFILALGGTGTLSLIVGILGFKLSPGKWLENGEVLSGFYNPTFWPQYFMRFALMQAITGAWAILMASRLPRDFPERRHIIRWAGIIGLVGLAAALLIGRVWYWHNIPARSKGLLSTKAFPAVTVQILVAVSSSPHWDCSSPHGDPRVTRVSAPSACSSSCSPPSSGRSARGRSCGSRTWSTDTSRPTSWCSMASRHGGSKVKRPASTRPEFSDISRSSRRPMRSTPTRRRSSHRTR